MEITEIPAQAGNGIIIREQKYCTNTLSTKKEGQHRVYLWWIIGRQPKGILKN